MSVVSLAQQDYTLELIFHNWRCFTEKRFRLPLSPLILQDQNGSGKTSLLAGLYSLFSKEPWPGSKWTHHLKSGANFFGVSTQFADWFIAGQNTSSGRLQLKHSAPNYLYFENKKTTDCTDDTDYTDDGISSLTRSKLVNQGQLQLVTCKIFTYNPTDNYWLSQSRAIKLSILDQMLGQVHGSNYLAKLKKLQKLVLAKQRLVKACQESEEQKTENLLLMQSLSKEIYQISLEIWTYRMQFWQFCQKQLLEFESWLGISLNNQDIYWFLSTFDGQKQKIDLQQFSTQTPKTFVENFLQEQLQLASKRVNSSFSNKYLAQSSSLDPLWLNLWQKEIAAKKVLFGAHRDDFELRFNRLPAQHFLSRGQNRMLVLFLKNLGRQLTQIQTESKIIWLVDDIFNELDNQRELVLLKALLAQSAWYVATSTKALDLPVPNYSLEQLTFV